jgi:hypothetical protein
MLGQKDQKDQKAVFKIQTEEGTKTIAARRTQTIIFPLTFTSRTLR